MATIDPEKTQTFPPGNYPPGTAKLPNKFVSGDITKLGFQYDISQHTDPTVVVVALLEYSFDNGVNWKTIGSFRRQGGPVTAGPSGIVTNLAGFWFGFPPKMNGTFRGSITLTGSSLNTSGMLWWL